MSLFCTITSVQIQGPVCALRFVMVCSLLVSRADTIAGLVKPSPRTEPTSQGLHGPWCGPPLEVI